MAICTFTYIIRMVSFYAKIDKGNYDVTEIYGYDEKTGNTYFQAAARKPMQREIYVADKSGKLTCLSARAG